MNETFSLGKYCFTQKMGPDYIIQIQTNNSALFWLTIYIIVNQPDLKTVDICL